MICLFNKHPTLDYYYIENKVKQKHWPLTVVWLDLLWFFYLYKKKIKYVSCAKKMYHMSPWPQIKLIHTAWISLQYALYRERISTKLYLLSKKDYPENPYCENCYFEKIVFRVWESHRNIYNMFKKQYISHLYYFSIIRPSPIDI